jgi:hypothetical protein
MLVSIGTRRLGHICRRLGVGVTLVLGVGLGVQGPVAVAASSAPRVLMSDGRIRFSVRPVATSSRAVVVEVFSPGPAPIRLRVRVHGGAFRLARAATTCLDLAALRAGEQCAVAVRFAPRLPGPKRGVLAIESGDGLVLARVGLSGAARASEEPHIVGLGVRPGAVAFGRQVVGTRSAPRLVTVTNPLAHPVVISRVVLTGASPGNFHIGRETCVGTLRAGAACTVRVRFAPRFVAVRTAGLVIVSDLPRPYPSVALTGRGASTVPSVPNAPLTLASIDRGCFYAPASPGGWPLAPVSAPHTIRGGFNDPRGPDMAHFGVDVSGHDRAAGLAVRAGTIRGIASVGNAVDEHFELASSDGVSRYFYYHVHPSVGDGTSVIAGAVLGRIEPGVDHVHLSEIVSGCGLVDPRRPTGILRDPEDTELPSIGPLAAYRATTAAYRPFRLDARPGPDPAAAVPLDGLHGLVDLRARVWDLPRHATVRWPQQPLMVAGARSYLAPLGRPSRHFGSVIGAFDGSRLIDPTRVYRVFAHGTYRINVCFTSKRPCQTVIRLHVASGGFDTRQFANGDYLYCVSAITIRSRVARRCTPVTIRN